MQEWWRICWRASRKIFLFHHPYLAASVWSILRGAFMYLKRGYHILLVLLLSLSGLFPVVHPAASESGDGESYSVWPMYGGGPSRRFYAPVDTSKNPGYVRWYFDAGSKVASSPVIGPDGNLYFATYDGTVYSLEPAGVLRPAGSRE